jgi:serine acetyltransferase
MPSLGSWRRWRRQVAARFIHAAWHRIQQAGTITADTAAGRRFAAFGPGSLIAFPVGTVYGEQWIEIGDGTMLGEQVSVCAGMMPGHDLGPGSVLRIGDRCVIGRGSHIVAHHSIDIGDDVYTGPYVYITDQNHSYADPDLPIGRQWPVNAPVRIGGGTWLGTGVIVLPGSVIGRNVVVAAGSVVRGEIGDRCVVAGVPARVIKGFDPETGWTRSAAGYARADAALSQVLADDSLGAFAGADPLPADPWPGDPQAGPVLPDSARPDSAAPDPALAESALAEAALADPSPVNAASPVHAASPVDAASLAPSPADAASLAPSPADAASLADLLLTPVPSEEPIPQPLLTDHDS